MCWCINKENDNDELWDVNFDIYIFILSSNIHMLGICVKKRAKHSIIPNERSILGCETMGVSLSHKWYSPLAISIWSCVNPCHYNLDLCVLWRRYINNHIKIQNEINFIGAYWFKLPHLLVSHLFRMMHLSVSRLSFHMRFAYSLPSLNLN